MWKWVCVFLVCLGGIGVFAVLRNKHPAEERPYLSVVGIVKMSDGVGRISAEVIDALKREMSINFIPTQETHFEDVPQRVRKIVMNENKTLGKVVLYLDSLWRPHHDLYKKVAFPKRTDQIRIAYSMFESTRILNEWVLILNTYFDAVAVPDEFFVDVYRESGVKLPIFVVPLGLKLRDFLSMPLKKNRKTPMVFANFSACTPRKNHLTLVRAFGKAFGNDPNFVLKINSRYSHPEEKKRLTTEIEHLGLTNVFFTELCLEKYAYLKMFEEVDCYVSLSKGEGFSIQPRESMAIGIPTIVSDNTAQHTICQSGLVRTVVCEIVEPAIYDWGTVHGHCFNCTEEDAANALLDVYRQYDNYLKMSQDARNWASGYEYKNLKGLFRSLVMPKKIILGQENNITEDCLTTNSQELYEKYLRILPTKLGENP